MTNVSQRSAWVDTVRTLTKRRTQILPLFDSCDLCPHVFTNSADKLIERSTYGQDDKDEGDYIQGLPSPDRGRHRGSIQRVERGYCAKQRVLKTIHVTAI